MVGRKDLGAAVGIFRTMGPLSGFAFPLPTPHGAVPRILPGPMEGVMTPWFCRAAARLELIEGWMTPFFRLSDNLPRRSKFARFLEPFLSSGRPVILQLMGNDTVLMAEAAALAAEHFPLAGIDVNFACPSPTVLRSGGGGALLRDPAAMGRIVAAMRDALPSIPLSVKIRTGYDDPAAMERFIPLLTGAGVDFISVHFRVVTEVYREVPGRLERLERAVRLAGSVPVIGSGDVLTAADAEALAGIGCAGVMGARGWLRDPLLLRRIRAAAEGQTDDFQAADDWRGRFFLALREEARKGPEPWPRPGLTGAAAFMWGAGDPRFRGLLQRDDRAFWNDPLD